MRDLAADTHLVDQAFEAARVRRERRWKELQGDGLTEADVIGAVDLAHAALAQRRDDAVAPREESSRCETDGRIAARRGLSRRLVR